MKLSVIDRVLLGNMMATYQGSFTNLKLIRVGREALSFTEEENRKLKFVPSGGNLAWDSGASVEFESVEILVSETVFNVIKGMLQKLNETEQLTEQHFSLYEKFVVPD